MTDLQQMSKMMTCFIANNIKQYFSYIIYITIPFKTWISSEDEGEKLQRPGYIHYYNFRLNNRGGGSSMHLLKTVSER